jgi:hypothetical protein
MSDVAEVRRYVGTGPTDDDEINAAITAQGGALEAAQWFLEAFVMVGDWRRGRARRRSGSSHRRHRGPSGRR